MDAQERIKWYRSPLPKETLRDMTRKSNWLGLAQIMAQFSLNITTAACALLAYRYLSWPFVVASVYVHGMFYGMLTPAAAGHELSHRTVFESRRLNEFFYRLVCFLSWTNGVKFRDSHMQHHQNTVHRGRDFEVILPIIIKPWQWIFFFTINVLDLLALAGRGRFHSIATTVRHALGIRKGVIEEHLYPSKKDSRCQAMFNWARIMLAGHLALAAIFIYYDLWIMFFVVTFAPFIASWFSLMFTLTQHTGLKPDVPDFRLCCRTVILNRFGRFVYWNMNYHIEHHMYAAVPFHKLPQLHQAIKSDLPTAQLGLVAAWKELLHIIPRQWKDPEGCLVPQVSNPHTG